MPTQSKHTGSEQPHQHSSLVTMRAPARPESVRVARAALSKTLCGWGLAEIADDMLQCLSEAFTNALLHGAPGEDVTVNVRYDGRITRVEVIDGGQGQPQMQAPPEATTDAAPRLADVATGGRGLLLIACLSDSWGVDQRADGKAVWFERSAGDPAQLAAQLLGQSHEVADAAPIGHAERHAASPGFERPSRPSCAQAGP